MKKLELQQKLHQYIETADEKKLKAIYTIVEDDLETAYNRWEDETFVAELNRREMNYSEGESPNYSLEESASRAKAAIKKLK